MPRLLENLGFFRMARGNLRARVPFVAALSIVILLSSCGGNNGRSSYALNAYVSGLTGSGLQVTLNGGAPIPISANSQTTLARLTNGTAYKVAVAAPPVSPLQSCIATNAGGKISGNNVDVMVNCVAALPGTVGLVPATVTIDSSVPSSTTDNITSVVSAFDGQKLGVPVYVPVGAGGGETMVLAVDSNNNILLAALSTSTSINLSAKTTALALVRLLMGALSATASESQVDAGISATADFPNLVSLISAALAANTPPSTSPLVFASTETVFNQIPASLVATLAAAHRSKVHAVLPVAQPSVVNVPYNMITTRAAGQVIGVVAIADATQDGGVKIDNSTAIAWSVTTTDTFGTPICTSLKTNPISGTCAVTIPRTTLLTNALNGISGGSPSSEDLPGNGAAFNVNLTQDTVSKTANVLQISEDFAQVFLTLASAGETAAIDPATATCISGVLEGLFPPTEVASLVLNPSASALGSYLKEVVFSPVSILKAVKKCPQIGVPTQPIGANPLGPVNWQSAVAQFILGVADQAEQEFLGGAQTIGNLAATTSGLPLEISEAQYYTFVKQLPITVGVCEVKVGQVYDIADCTASLQFNPAVFTMASGSVYTPTLQALNISGKATMTPTDLVYSTPISNVGAPVISRDPTSGQVTALALPTGSASAQASVTVTQQSTGISANYTVTVTQATVLKISPASPSVAVGSTIALTVSASDGSGNAISTPPSLAWASSDTTIATVVGGVVTGVAAGSVTVTATDPVSKAFASTKVVVTAATTPPCNDPSCKPPPPGVGTCYTATATLQETESWPGSCATDSGYLFPGGYPSTNGSVTGQGNVTTINGSLCNSAPFAFTSGAVDFGEVTCAGISGPFPVVDSWVTVTDVGEFGSTQLTLSDYDPNGIYRVSCMLTASLSSSGTACSAGTSSVRSAVPSGLRDTLMKKASH
jgi:hypothetical protein